MEVKRQVQNVLIVTAKGIGKMETGKQNIARFNVSCVVIAQQGLVKNLI